jgi:predicted exporter/SAM-dependent methyltransferase
MKLIRLNLPLFAVTILAILALLAGSVYLVKIDTDITNFLPQKEPVFSDATYVFTHHPLQGEMAIDLGVATADPDRLVQCGERAEQRMRESGLFARVGTESIQALIPDLFNHITDNLPVLFTREALNEQVLPLLSPARIRERMAELQRQLLDLSAIGQAGFIARDPLAIRHLIMAHLAHLAPSGNIEVYKGKLLSRDKKHLLLVASPAQSATDTAFAGRLDALMQAISDEVSAEFGRPHPVVFSPVGAYRAALDNERIARRDVQQALIFSTIGIAILLILSFPRPVVGLFAFLPAVAGTVAAFFVLALCHKTVSIIALGFGGAIISMTVDCGIAYLLFLDRSETASCGRAVSAEIWAVGLIAALTTVGAFAALSLTGFPVFIQLGQFSALGIAFSFLFVHSVFPRIFPELPPAMDRPMPFRRWVAALPEPGKWAALAAIAFGVGMSFFANPKFNVSLTAMNTVSRETAAAEELMTTVWGAGIFNKIYVMTEGASPGNLQNEGDRLLPALLRDMAAGRLDSGFLPAMIFPGETLSRQNFSDWQAFWTPERVKETRLALEVALEYGFTADAFTPFLEMISADAPPAGDTRIPEKFYPLLGVSRQAEGPWMQVAAFTPGPGYDPGEFRAHYGKTARIFDPNFFSERLGGVLFFSFMEMLVVIGISLTALLIFFFLDVKLTAIILTPVVFAMVSTLGTMKFIEKSLDIPALMLSIIVLGMGVDYALYLVRAYQRYGGSDSPAFERIKLTVILAATSTLIGFGVLCFAGHTLLRSAGLTFFLGIGYSLIGAFVILPPLLKHHFRLERGKSSVSTDWRKRVRDRYRPLEVYPRLFARFKMKTDVMFSELPRFFSGCGEMRTVLDIGCGFGVPGCWILEHFNAARIYGIDPDPERIRVAARVFGEKGVLTCAAAPEIPKAPEPADAAFLLDILHFLDDTALRLTLSRLQKSLHAEALLVIRAVVPPPGKPSRLWKLDAFRMRLAGIPVYHRSVEGMAGMIADAGFHLQETCLSGANPESVWMIATAMSGAGGSAE